MVHIAVLVVAVAGVMGLGSSQARAHNNSCHQQRTCPSDDGSYEWLDPRTGRYERCWFRNGDSGNLSYLGVMYSCSGGGYWNGPNNPNDLLGSENPYNEANFGLPTVGDLPGSGLDRRSAQPLIVQGARAPYPCAQRRALGMRATPQWGEWTARGAGRTARVLTFAYSERQIGKVWSDLRDAIRACPRVTKIEADNGSRGTATLISREDSEAIVRMDVVTQSATGSRTWNRDRAVVYQRVDNAIQKVEVTRRILEQRDRVLAERIARISKAKYIAARAEDEPEALGGGVDVPLDNAIAALPAGAKLNVAIGDSMASGEGGRWRGNVFWQTNWPQVDAYGERAYWDTPTGESIPGCHRALGAEIHIPGTYGLNLACSGARTTSMWAPDLLTLGQYKPGVDDGMVDPKTGERRPGQLTMLDRVARRASIGSVVLSIGGNDMGFGAVMTSCIGAFLRPWPFEQRCQDDAEVRRRLSPEALAAVGVKVEAAILRTITTMRKAGYADGSWQLIVQDYPRLIAEDARYDDTYLGRLYAGGCPIHSADVAWLGARVPMTDTIREAVRRAAAASGQPVQFLDVSDLFAGRELCARDAAQVDAIPAGEITARAERVQMVRGFAPFQAAESLHPNRLGQQALQACVREAINGGSARSGRCEAPLDWGQVDSTGLPLVRFAPTP